MALPRLPYTLNNVFQRRIAKFGVQGTEYRLTVGTIDEHLAYTVVLDAIHDLFDSEYITMRNYSEVHTHTYIFPTLSFSQV